jgi:hypothetical protein
MLQSQKNYVCKSSLTNMSEGWAESRLRIIVVFLVGENELVVVVVDVQGPRRRRLA